MEQQITGTPNAIRDTSDQAPLGYADAEFAPGANVGGDAAMGTPETLLPTGQTELVAEAIVDRAQVLFDTHVSATVAEIGDKVQAHVAPTIARITGVAKETVVAGRTLQATTTELRTTSDQLTERHTQLRAEIGAVDTSIQQRIVEIDAIDTDLRTRIGDVEALVVSGLQRAQVVERATREEIVSAIREIRETGAEQEKRVVRKMELDAQPTHVHLPLLEAAIQANVPAYMHGTAGSGKTTGAQQVAERHDLPFRHVSVNPTTTESKLLGYRDASGNYNPTGLRQIYGEDGEGGVFLFDEVDNGTPAALTTVNAMIANGHGEFPDGRIARHSKARFVAAANTIGQGADAQYVGRNKLDGAFLDRFAFIPWDEDRGLTRAIVLGQPSRTTPIDIREGGVPTPEDWLDVTQAAQDAIGALSMKHLVTPRAAIYGNMLAQEGVGRRHLADMLIFKGMKPAERNKIEARMGISSGSW